MLGESKPAPKQVNETKVAKLHGCPQCGSKLREIHKHEQYVSDIPVVVPVITRYVTYSGYCADCHKRVRSQHPEQTSQATGAAGVLVGPRAKALAADLKHRLGGSYGKVSETLNDAFGLQVSRSGWCQADQRLAEKAYPVYQELIEVIRRSSVVHADETGWRIGTLSAWLWVFTNQEATVYAIRENRSSDVVVEILGKEFKGILASDCFVAYDDKRLAAWLKQKCLAHLLKDLKWMEESKTGRAVHFAQQLTTVLQAALKLKDRKNQPGSCHLRLACAGPGNATGCLDLQATQPERLVKMYVSPDVCANIARICCASCMWMAWMPPITRPNANCDRV